MPSVQGNIYESFAQFTFGLTFERIPEDVVSYAEDLLLDLIGVAAAASTTEAGRIARETAYSQMAAGPNAEAAQMIFDGRKAGIVGAAYAGATQIDNFDGHDGYAPNKGHIGVALLPALLALADARPGIAGREALLGSSG